MTSSGGNVQISQSNAANSQGQTSASSTPISLVNSKSIILNPTAQNHRLAIPIVLANQIDSNASKKCTQTQNKVTLQSLKSFMDTPATSSSVKNTSIQSLIMNNMSTSHNQPKPVSSPKIVLSNTNKPASSGQATTIAQICASLTNNQYKIQTSTASQQLISQMIPNSIRLIANPSLVNSTICSPSGSCSNANLANSAQSPSSSPLKPNIIRKPRRDSPSSHSLSVLQNSIGEQANSLCHQSKPPCAEPGSLQVATAPGQSQNANQTQYMTVPVPSLFTTSSTSASPSSSSTSTQSIPKNINSVIKEALQENSSTSSKSQTIRKMTESRDHSPQPSTSSQPSDSNTTEASINRKRRKQEFKKQSVENSIGTNPLLGHEKRSNQSNEMEESEPALKLARVHNQLIKTDKKRTHSIKIKDHDLDEPFLDDQTVELLSKEFSFVDREGVKWTTKRQRSQFSIDKCYTPDWKPKQNHFAKYSDISLAQTQSNGQSNTITRKQLVDNLNEWRFHYVISQVNDLIDYENESLEVMNEVDDFLKSSKLMGLSDICLKISESIKANSQRHKYVNQQLDETQLLIHKLFDHKEKYKNYLIISANGGLASTNSSGSSMPISQPFSSNSLTKKKLKKSFKTSQINTRNNLKSETKLKSK